MMEPRISLITLGVRDLAEATRFYQEGLGLPLDEETKGISFFPLQGTWLALYPRDMLAADAAIDPAGGGFPGITLAHNVRSKEEVRRLMKEAKIAGATIIKEATEAEWGGYLGYFADLDGHLWEIAWNPFFPLP